MVHGNPVGVGSIGLGESKNEGRSGMIDSVDVQGNPEKSTNPNYSGSNYSQKCFETGRKRKFSQN